MDLSAPLAASLQAVFGVAVFLGVAYALSEARAAVRWRPVLLAVGVQAVLAVLTTYVDAVHQALLSCSDAIGLLKDATAVGTKFVFGYVGGGAEPFVVTQPEKTFVFATQALPMVMVV
ncbi:Na+ dependent nucleoside transporter N-terminal domain-containing protein, partial [Jatrophihabitans endophyticus]|uniref:Na+ dependent nucleoside transporter N-terminal domain-containing protein n=1 Tax=Jatrophihabitans endophyticus TaxID=1206085 RepID=UPI001A04D658